MTKTTVSTGERSMPVTNEDPSPLPRGPIPTQDLRRRLLALVECYAWMTREWPAWIWMRPRSPFDAQSDLTQLLEHVERLRAHCDDVIVHADLLWTLAGEDAKRNAA